MQHPRNWPQLLRLQLPQRSNWQSLARRLRHTDTRSGRNVQGLPSCLSGARRGLVFPSECACWVNPLLPTSAPISPSRTRKWHRSEDSKGKKTETSRLLKAQPQKSPSITYNALHWPKQVTSLARSQWGGKFTLPLEGRSSNVTLQRRVVIGRYSSLAALLKQHTRQKVF